MTFDRALPHILKYEGGWWPGNAGDPNPTNFGITQATYDRFRDSLGVARQSVRHIARHEVEDIYETRYWQPLGCDRHPWPVCLVLLDTGVNHGVGRARQFLREVGPHPEALLQRRERFYHAIVARRPETKQFLKGWLNRMQALRQEVQRVTV